MGNYKNYMVKLATAAEQDLILFICVNKMCKHNVVK